jgi:flagellar protein FlaG
MAIATIGNSGTQNAAPASAAPQGTSAPTGKAPAVVPVPVPQQQAQPAQVQKAVESFKRMIETQAPNSLAFAVDSSTGKTIVRITDVQTGEMIRQIPSEEMLEIARSLDKLQGVLLNKQA